MKSRVKVLTQRLREGDCVFWPSSGRAIVIVEDLENGMLFVTRHLTTGKKDWLQGQDWLDGDWTVVRAVRLQSSGG